jgi:hypothetical protein
MCSHCPENTQVITSSGTLPIGNGGTSTTYSHQFESDKESSSKTKCKICGLEKWQHPMISYT